MSRRRELTEHILKLRCSLDYFLCVRADRVDLQTILSRVLDGGLYHVFAYAFAPKLVVNFRMIDGHRRVVLDVGELCYPLAVLIDKERTLSPVFVVLNLHHASITTNGGPHFHRFVRIEG